MKIKLTKETYISLSLIIMIFSSYLSFHTTGIISKFFNNFDELFALTTFLYFLKIKDHTKLQNKILLLQFCFITTGIIGSIINKYQPLNYVIKDAINCSKFIGTLLGVISLYNKNNNEKIVTLLQDKSRKLILIFFMLTIIDLLFQPSFLVHSTKKFGIYELSLIYYHPAILAQMLILLISILSFKNANESIKHKNVYIAMCLLMLIFTFVTKAIGFAFIYLFINNYKKIFKNKIISFFIIILVSTGLFFIASDSIKTYYGSMENTARGKLTIGSIEIAKRYFPYGGGLGTYGSASAIEHYSPIYKELGFDKVYGLGYVTTKYATDTFWPIIIGEYGYIGLIIYVILILNLIKIGIRLIKNETETFIPYISLLSYLLICSTSSTSFFNPVAVAYAIIMAICIAKNYNVNKKI